MKLEKGTLIKFKAAAPNTGALTVDSGRGPGTLHRYNEPLRAGELQAGDTVIYDSATGHVINIIKGEEK